MQPDFPTKARELSLRGWWNDRVGHPLPWQLAKDTCTNCGRKRLVYQLYIKDRK
jgi:hypothetical protein